MRLAILAALGLSACTPATLSTVGTAYQLGCDAAPVIIEHDPLPTVDGEEIRRVVCPE